MTNSLKTRLLTVPQFALEHPAFSQSSLRHLIFDANTNGFRQVIKRVGRKILIDETAFFHWIEEQQQ